MKKYFFLPFLLILLIFSCEDSSYLFREEEQWTVDTIFSGQWLYEGDFVPVEMEYDTELQSDDLLVFLLERNDEIYMEYQGLLGSMEGFFLPEDLPQGEYTLKYQVYRDDDMLNEVEISFFVYDGNYGLRDIELFPPLIREGASVLARVDLAEPDDSSNPWLVWRLGDEVIQEAYLQDGGNHVNFVVPEIAGVYPLEVDIFPEEPFQWVGLSPFMESTEIFVTRGDAVLYPTYDEDLYPVYSLFDGSMELSSLEQQRQGLILRDRYMLGDTHGSGITGTEFREPSFVRFDGFALPAFEGRLQSQTHSFYFQLEESDEEQREHIFHTESPGDSSSFSISRIDQELVISFGALDEYHRLSVYLKENHLYRPLMLTVELQNKGETMKMIAYLDGKFQDEIEWEGSPEIITEGGETIMGSWNGTPGFNGILFSWMVYSKEVEEGIFQPLQNVYKAVREMYWGENLIVAEGFDGEELAPEFSLNRWNSNPEGSRLFMNGGDILYVEDIPLIDGILELELDGYFVDLPLMMLETSTGKDIPLPFEGHPIIVKLEDKTLFVSQEDDIWERASQYSFHYDETVTLSIEATDTTIIDSLFIHR